MHALDETPKIGRLALLVGVAAATVGIIYGYDSSNIGGALLYLTRDFDLDAGGQSMVTTVVVVGEIVGALFGGAVANRLGRKPTIVGVATGFALFSLLSALAPTGALWFLVIARLLLGVTIGISVVVVPVFVVGLGFFEHHHGDRVRHRRRQLRRSPHRGRIHRPRPVHRRIHVRVRIAGVGLRR